MSSTTIANLIKTIESLPEPLQRQVAEHLQEYIEDLKDELQWDTSFQKTQQQLKAAAQRVKQEIAEGKAQQMEAIKGIQQGLNDFEVGRYRSFQEFAEEKRRKYNLPSPQESFRQAWQEIKTGNIRPVSELWEGIDAE